MTYETRLSWQAKGQPYTSENQAKVAGMADKIKAAVMDKDGRVETKPFLSAMVTLLAEVIYLTAEDSEMCILTVEKGLRETIEKHYELGGDNSGLAS
jgi:hypothetical protein